jgi:enamine deaminase RidA (YjgF/YER057c/UK114 family)
MKNIVSVESFLSDIKEFMVQESYEKCIKMLDAREMAIHTFSRRKGYVFY